jgi:hypothetical protein
MTKINYIEYDSLLSFDQCLVWAITTLAAANRHPENKDLLSYVTIRPEAVDFVTWQVQTDADGQPYLTGRPFTTDPKIWPSGQDSDLYRLSATG